MMKNSSLILVLLVSVSFSFGQSSTSDFFKKADSFFKEYVKNGLVDYAAIKNNPDALNEVLEMASNISVSKDQADEYKAFWINGYNLLVIDGVIKKYPIKSPLDQPGFFDKEKKNLAGEVVTLNDIENKLLRKNFPKEARFHFVLVCGGLGCPPIINEAYVPSKLDEQLERQTTKAINDPKFIRLQKNKLKISQIFEWYKSDFEHEGKVTDFINKYRSEKLPEKVKVSYYPYDWTLNEAQ